MSDCRSCRSSTSRSLRCNICGKTFPYNPECIGKLGQHNCEEHWIHKIGHFVNKKSKCGTPMEIQWIANAKVNVKRLKRENFLDLYKTTIESWHDGPTELRCCSCGYEGPPYIRKQKNKVTSTRLGQYLLMACWPLCFAPMASQNEITLYCKKCGALFGSYDMDNGILIQSCCTSRADCTSSNCGKC
ncbi:uncharacterized protein LOC123673593 isoform X1 [Harmonia axyridis]|uniref:uncharacterized protein LOC123673593 isoform X1 n=1 Tax=Harmonia axyridis TaxID=115357 RepID=UPI001E279315|nr:uncharacterized protein LOC123673593 isoform X1 [Harmonia axyridis]